MFCPRLFSTHCDRARSPLITYRSFLNTDTPHIVSIWKQQRKQRTLSETMFQDVFERCVLSKPFFENAGLILAEQDNVPLGFVHCGFGPNSDRSDLDRRRGIICLLLTISNESRTEVCDGLLEQAHEYFCNQGTETVSIGTDFPFSPFYLGLYGGSNVPGVLLENRRLLELMKRNGYQEQQQVLIMQRSLHDFRAVLDRRQTSVRRGYRIQFDQDPLPKTWWEACTLGNTNRSVFTLFDRKSSDVHGRISYWDMEPLARNWGVRAMGLFDCSIEPEARKAGLGTFLVSESLRHMQQQGISLVEAQVAEDNLPAISLFEKMGFESVNTGILLKRSLKSE